MRSIVTLTTDFGMRDYFVGAMKGVILGINPKARIVDISHEIPPQDVVEAAFVLGNVYSYFPRGTVHLAVVDPGVGGERKPIVVRTESHLLVGPDNGVFSLICAEEKVQGVYEIANRELMLPQVSNTFHGRDIFAPAAAHLSMGTKPSEFGSELFRWVQLDFAKPKGKGELLVGQVVHADRFGNLVTNISQRQFESFVGGDNFEVLIGSQALTRISSSYVEVEEDKVLAIFGSAGLLEISVSCGNAEKLLGMKRGDRVYIKRKGH